MLHLLPLLCLLLLAQASLSQQAGAPATNGVPSSCPVTKPYQTSLFVPSSPYEANAGAGSFWFGTDRLWTVLPTDGTWKGLGHYTPNDPTFRQKMQWWRQGYDWHTEPKPKLKVTGKRLDATAPPLIAEANNVIGPPPSMMVGMNFPTLGCWGVTGRYGDDTVTFVVWLAK
jgi:hypothetical protein